MGRTTRMGPCASASRHDVSSAAAADSASRQRSTSGSLASMRPCSDNVASPDCTQTHQEHICTAESRVMWFRVLVRALHLVAFCDCTSV